MKRTGKVVHPEQAEVTLPDICWTWISGLTILRSTTLVPLNRARAPHNRPHSDGRPRQVGVTQQDGLNVDDAGYENGRSKWTRNLRDDLLTCYDSSEPTCRGYMAPLHEIWCVMHTRKF